MEIETHFKRSNILSIAVLMALAFTPTSAVAHKPEEVKAAVVESLVHEFSARQLGRKCRSLSFNIGGAFKAAKALKASMEAAGHKKSEVNKAALSISIKKQSAAATKLIVSKGVDTSDKSTYCAVGHAEVEAKSAIGALLKAK